MQYCLFAYFFKRWFEIWIIRIWLSHGKLKQPSKVWMLIIWLIDGTKQSGTALTFDNSKNSRVFTCSFSHTGSYSMGSKCMDDKWCLTNFHTASQLKKRFYVTSRPLSRFPSNDQRSAFFFCGKHEYTNWGILCVQM